MVASNHKLTNLQLELLRLFAHPLSEGQLLEVKTLLSGYFEKIASDEMDRLWDEKCWTGETMNEWANEHNRTPYNKGGV
jgi:hypothetical protein